jgi:hypothetical protein
MQSKGKVIENEHLTKETESKIDIFQGKRRIAFEPSGREKDSLDRLM